MRGQRFLDRVAQADPLTVTVLASSKFPMSHDPIKNVTEFHEVFNCPIGTTPSVPDDRHELPLRQVHGHLVDLRALLRQYSKDSVRCQRAALLIEEVAEQVKALADRDIKGVLDAASDIEYINVGTVITCGLQDVFYESSRRVHESNMSKTDENGKAIYDASGKVMKGPNYKPVDLTDLVDGTWLEAQK